MRFHALGALAVSDRGSYVPVGGPRQRRLLAMLLIHRNAVVSADRLADAVFAGEPTAAASTTLRSYVARMRKALETTATEPVLLTRAPGYVLNVADDDFDVACFERLLAEARGLAGQHSETVATLRKALALWRGEAYAEFRDEDWARPEAERLDGLRLAAHEQLFDAAMADGRAGELVPEIDSLVRTYPLREGLRAQGMLALYRAGRQAEALATFQDYRALLVEELGLEPTPELTQLQERILAHDPSLLVVAATGPALRGYQLGERLGIGRGGPVYAARVPGVSRGLVIRLIHAELADRPSFVRSFESDARRLVTLGHPAVVPIHDYWREPGAAYLVMRRLYGGTLSDRLAGQEPTREETAQVVARIGSALCAAGDVGIRHGRLTADAVLFDDRGEPYLTDFALGESEERPGGDDARNLAVLVRRMLPDEDGPLADLLELAGGEEHPPLADVVRQLVETLTEAERSTDPGSANPYKGLRAFDEADADDFFGRSALVDDMVKRLGRSGVEGRLLLVVGGSGTGKSSVVRAGLVPRLRRGAVPGSDEWFITTMVPGAAPFKAFADALQRVAVREESEIATELAGSPEAVDRVVRRILPEAGQLLVVIDQLEELFTAADEDDQRRFLDAIMHAVTTQDSRLRVVATLRADYFDRPLAFHAFGSVVDVATVAIPAMSPAELTDAIVAPAARVGREIERDLVVELVDALSDEPAGLPALQFTLFELAAEGEALSLASYRALGGLQGAIASRAEELYLSLEKDERRAVRSLFEQLVAVTPEGEPTRRRASRAELLATVGDPPLGTLVDRWVEAGLLSLDRDPRSRLPVVEVAHEALLRAWPRLRVWIAEDRDTLLVLGRLRDAAIGWLDVDRDVGALYRGARLQVALDVTERMPDALPPLEREFLEASVEERDKEVQEAAGRLVRQSRINRRLRVQLAVIAGALVVALAGGFVAVDQGRAAEHERRVATVRELAAASAANLDDDPERSILLALEAVEVTRARGEGVLPEAVEALHRAVVSSRLLLSVPAQGGALDWSPDGRLFVTEGPEESGIVDLRDAATGASVLSFAGHDIDVNDVAFSADGSMVATGGDDGVLRVWTAGSGEEIATFGAPSAGPVWGPSFSPDGHLVAASWMDAGRVAVYDLATGEEVAAYEGPRVQGTAFSPDGATVVFGHVDGSSVEVLDVSDGSIAMTVPLEEELVREAAFSPDGSLIAVAAGSGTTYLLDAETGRQSFVITGHTSAVNGLDWNRDGTRLATVSDDGTARVHSVGDGVRELLVLSARDTRNGLASVAFSPEGDRIMTGDWGIVSAKVWDVTETGGAEWMNARSVPFVRGSGDFLPDGTVVGSVPGGHVAFWDADTGEVVRTIEAATDDEGEVRRMALSPDGAILATADTLPVRLWEVASGSLLHTIETPTRTDPSGAPVAPGDVFVVELAWSPEGDHLAIAEADGEGGAIAVVDRSGRELARIGEEPGVYVRSLAFGADGRHLVATRLPPRDDPARQGFRIWDWAAGEIVQEVVSEAVTVAVDPTGTRLATTRQLEGSADIWDIATGDHLATLPGASSFYDVTFGPDGSQVATAGADGTIRLWDPERGAQLAVLRGHAKAVGSVTFSPDGTRLSSLDEDGLFRVWALDPEHLIALAQERVTRTLDDNECRQFLHLEQCDES